MGAYVLTALPGEKMKPFVASYLLIMGLVVLRKAFKKTREKAAKTRLLLPLGLVGGFCDAIGGGGWGPIVTSTLVARGHNPRFTVGSVNLAEFFVTTAEVTTFSATIGLTHWQVVVGLIAGGIVAAPLAAYVCKRLPTRILMTMVGAAIVALSVRTIYLALF